MARRIPYTNFHDLNLDWIIKRIQNVYNDENPPPYPVRTVNGQVGNVHLTGDDIPVSPNDNTEVSTALASKYVKPSGGIPKSDLSAGVQSYLNSIADKLDKPSVAGQAGQVLTSDGMNGQSWQTPTDPATIIDDASGYGVSDKTWSAGKLFQMEADILDLDNDKIDEPAQAGTAGQVLTLDNSLDPTWANPVDPTLTDPTKGAPADIVGDIQNDINDINNKLSIAQYNLINPNAITLNKRINSSGALEDDSTYSVSDYIECNYGDHIYFSFLSNSNVINNSLSLTKIVYFNSEKTRLGESSNVNNKQIAVLNTAYIRLQFTTTWLSNGTLSLTIGSYPATASAFKFYVNKYNLFKQITNVSTESELVDALKNAYIINIVSDITITQELTVANDVQINGNGHTLTGSGLSRHLMVINGCNTQIRNLNMTNGHTSVLVLISAYNTILENCDISVASDCIISAQGTGTLFINNCKVHGSTGNDGLSAKEYAIVYVHNCKFYDNYDEGFTSHNSTYCEIYDSEFYKNGYVVGTTTKGAVSSFGGCHVGGGYMGIVSGCYSHDNCTYGFGIINFQDDTRNDFEMVWNNIAKDNGGAGFWLTGARDLILANNTIIGNGGDAIHFGLDTTYTPTISLVASTGYVTKNTMLANNNNNVVIDAGADNGIVIAN